MHSKLLNKNIAHIIQEELKSTILNIATLSGGKNSCVYRISCVNNQNYVAKFYFDHQSDKRNRLNTEYSTLQFLHLNNISNVPIPLFKSNKFKFAIIEYIHGTKIQSENVTYADIDTLVDFLFALNQLKLNKKSLMLANASEACFSINDYIFVIHKRLERIKKLEKNQSVNEMLFFFVNDQFLPTFTAIKKWCHLSNYCSDQHIDIDQKTLSPSDYGFHNALRLTDSQIKFIDFEYFGWDDPAKMICDFLLHPAMELSFEMKRYFFNSIIGLFEDYQSLEKRIMIVYPLVALKWCMILLNEFIPEHLLRRSFSGDCRINVESKQKEQLNKSKNMLQRAIDAYETFPFK